MVDTNPDVLETQQEAADLAEGEAIYHALVDAINAVTAKRGSVNPRCVLGAAMILCNDAILQMTDGPIEQILLAKRTAAGLVEGAAQIAAHRVIAAIKSHKEP